MSRVRRIAPIAIAGIIIAALFSPGVSAHEEDEFTFVGEAVESCLTPGATTWHVEWTITDDENANPFGIIDADTSDNQDVVFSPLHADVGDGYIDPGDSASATTTHAASLASVTLEVEHDVTRGDNTFWEVTVDRPLPCADDDASITVRKSVNNVANDPTNFNVDFSAGVPDITNIDENDGNVTRGGLAAGLYILTEYGIPATYAYVEWDCTSDTLGADIDVDDVDMSVAIQLRAHEDVFCVLINRLRPPTPTPTATVVPATATPAPTATPTPSGPSASDLALLAVIDALSNQKPPTVNVIAPAAPAAPVVPAQPIAPSAPGIIRPPSTGDAGLLPPPAKEVVTNEYPCGWEYVRTVYDAHYELRVNPWGGFYWVYVPYRVTYEWQYVC